MRASILDKEPTGLEIYEINTNLYVYMYVCVCEDFVLHDWKEQGSRFIGAL